VDAQSGTARSDNSTTRQTPFGFLRNLSILLVTHIAM